MLLHLNPLWLWISSQNHYSRDRQHVGLPLELQARVPSNNHFLVCWYFSGSWHWRTFQCILKKLVLGKNFTFHVTDFQQSSREQCHPSISPSIIFVGSSLSRMFQPSFSPATRYSLGHWEAFPGQMKHIILSAGSGVPSQLGVSEKPQSEVPRRHHSSGFTLGSLRISKFLTLSLWLSPAELWRWLILVVCICNLTLLNRHPDLMTIDGLKCTLTGKTKASPSSPVLLFLVQYNTCILIHQRNQFLRLNTILSHVCVRFSVIQVMLV